jgi:hypothetical protein
LLNSQSIGALAGPRENTYHAIAKHCCGDVTSCTGTKKILLQYFWPWCFAGGAYQLMYMSQYIREYGSARTQTWKSQEVLDNKPQLQQN